MSDLIRLDDVPDLQDFVPASVDLSSEYWTPEPGDARRMVFWGIEKRIVPAHDNSNKQVELDCAIFIEPKEDGNYSTVSNASKRLVAAFANNSIERGTPVQVVYVGKKQNRTNSFKSDHWSIVTLRAKDAK